MNALNFNTTLLIVGFAVLVISMVVAAVLLWQSKQAASRIIAVVMVVACLVLIVGAVGTVPVLIGNASGGVQVAAQGTGPSTLVPSPTEMPVTATATSSPTPSVTPTALPSLTPAPSATDIVLVTPLVYQVTDAAAKIDCSVTANTMLNLRGDPSAKRQAIGKVFAGSLLPVTGVSADKKWLQVSSGDGTVTITGWVSTQYVTVDKACDMTTVPVIDATPSGQ